MINPRPSSEAAAELFRSLAALLVEKPGALRVACQEADDGAAYFAIKGDPEDEGKLVGKGGSHAAAFRFLAERMGMSIGRPWNLKVITVRDPRMAAARATPLVQFGAVEFDTGPIGKVLLSTLEQLGYQHCIISVGPGSGPRDALTFHFKISGDKIEKLALLHRWEKRAGMSEEEAITTLLRGIAKRAGVRVEIEIDAGES